MNTSLVIVGAEIISFIAGAGILYLVAGHGKTFIKNWLFRRTNPNIGIVRLFDEKGEVRFLNADFSKKDFHLVLGGERRTYLVDRDSIYYLSGGVPCSDYNYDDPHPIRYARTGEEIAHPHIDNSVFDSILLKAVMKPRALDTRIFFYILIGVGASVLIGILLYMKILDVTKIVQALKPAQTAIQANVTKIIP